MINKLSTLTVFVRTLSSVAICGHFAFTSTATALEIDGLQLPDSFQIEDKLLRPNGYGTRHYSLLKIKVYSAALYTTKKIINAAAVLASTEPQVIHLKMHRSTSQSDAIKGWEYYLDANCKNECMLPNATRTEFLQATAALKVGDEETYIFSGGGLLLKRNGKLIAVWQSPALAKVVLSAWFGAVPTSEQLKSELISTQKDAQKDAKN